MLVAALRTLGMTLLLWGVAMPLLGADVRSVRAADGFGGTGMPRTGQPASDILGSFDVDGSPTFVGGLTNLGPTVGSVW